MREHAAPMGCAVVILLALAGSAAADTTGRYALEMSGERYGLVVLKPDATQLVVSVQDLPRPLVSLVTAFASGKPVKRDMRLASGAISGGRTRRASSPRRSPRRCRRARASRASASR